MSAFDGKEDTERLGSIRLVPIPRIAAAQDFPAIDAALQVDIRDERFVVFGLALNKAAVIMVRASTIASSKRSPAQTHDTVSAFSGTVN